MRPLDPITNAVYLDDPDNPDRQPQRLAIGTLDRAHPAQSTAIPRDAVKP